ncbi:nitrate- and nitrite sensing domain-containing protein [Nocardiopsis rhodophaea]|uniref:sensor histidine kinase n=2 Tax=Nocardiopsis rhodophaea TaxID=280238 RepID=UPI0031DC4D53
MSTRATEHGAGAPTEEPTHDVEAAPKRRVRWFAPRNWRVRSRLVALIVIPTAVALVLGGLRISESVVNTVTHDRIKSTASLGEAVVKLGNRLGQERSASAVYIADDPNPEKRDEKLLRELQDRIQETKQAKQKVDSEIQELGDPGTDLGRNRMSQMLNNLDSLDTVRKEVQESRITVLPAATKYRQVINSLTDFNQTIAESTDDTGLRESVRAMTAVSRAREHLSYESALMLHSLMRGSMSSGVQEAISSSRARYDNEIQNFTGAATVGQRQMFDDTFKGLDVSRMETTRLRVMMRLETDQKLTGVTDNDDADSYDEAAGSTLNKMEKVEQKLAGSVGSRASSLESDALWRAVVETLIVLLVIMAVFAVTSLVVRSLVQPLRRLREGAIRIAEEDLPDSITRMQETSSAPEEVTVAPIEVGTEDEIGEVARSFDEVHRVALRLASEEAALRSNVNAMFVNLSRRSQTLVERQLRLIDGLEQSEQDSDRLSDLFSLDHLATRMRRNNENLLVLSGQDNTRKWAQPVPLVDVLRAAASEVEQYERVNVRAPSHISVLGRPVNDVIHLVAELVENATSFSPNDSEVSVEAEALDNGGVRIEVTDSGIGMDADELTEINERLSQPPVIDVAVSRRMGLFVVSRLAARHGIQVRLHPAHNGGITATAVFPSDLLITPVEPTGGQPSALPPVPDTYAEATAAFAANPAPAEPGDMWQTGDSGEERASGLPKRQPGAGVRSDEHPPSGEDLWGGSGWNTPPSTPTDPPSPSPSTPPASEPPAVPEEWPSTPSADPASTSGPGTGPQLPRERPSQWSADSWAGDAFGGDSTTSSFDAFGGDRRGTGDTGAFPAGPAQPERPVQPPAEPPSAAPEPPAAAPEPPAPGWTSAGAPAGTDGPDHWRGEREPVVDPWARGPEQAAPHPVADPDSREGYGSTAYLSRRYGNGGAGHSTVVPPSPDGGGEALPIFDAIESNWFRRRSGGPTAAEPETGPMPRMDEAGSPVADGAAAAATPQATPESSAPQAAAPEQQPEDEWRSDADRGWKAARSAAEPMAGGLTSSGLPKRVPKANLVPGTVPQPDNVRQIPSRSADRVRNRFAGLQRGVQEGRQQGGGRSSEEK